MTSDIDFVIIATHAADDRSNILPKTAGALWRNRSGLPRRTAEYLCGQESDFRSLLVLIKDAQSVVLVDYRGLTVEEDTQLRKQLREAGIIYKVYKNTLMNFAFKGTDCESMSSLLEGPSAIAVSKEDATAPARILAKFAKEAPALEMKAGVVEGTFYDQDGIKVIANIPSRDELLAKLFGSLQSPITNLARVLNQIAEQGGGAADAAVEAAPAEEAPAEEAPAAEA